MDFCNNIDSVFEDTADPEKVLQNTKFNSEATLSLEEKELLTGAIRDLRKQVADNRILLKPSFMDFDRAKSCYISA